MLYFIKSQNYVKIGYSKDFETLVDRMRSYCTHNPYFILLSFTECGTNEDETDLHYLCAKYKYSTEWFKDDIEVYKIWENYVKRKNLIPKNCFCEFPEDLRQFSLSHYRQSWDGDIVFQPNESEEKIHTESNEIALMKYFGRKRKSFSKEDFIKACKLCEKELNIKIDKSTLKDFGYDIAGNTGIITVYKLQDMYFDE